LVRGGNSDIFGDGVLKEASFLSLKKRLSEKKKWKVANIMAVYIRN
jgi:hypothetical protein